MSKVSITSEDAIPEGADCPKILDPSRAEW